MSDSLENQAIKFIELAGDIVSAYVSNNSVPVSELPALIQGIHAALVGLANGAVQAAPEAEIEKPSAAQIRKSVTPEGIVSFLDGRSYKTLKRHLNTQGLSPETYRSRFGLPADYPMVAPEYAKRRSDLAKSIGLGRVVDRSDAA
jgi:predicted transcriptional regulator